MARRADERPSLAKQLAILASALILSALLLPAMIVGWYYVSPDSFRSAVGFMAAVTDSAAAPASEAKSSEAKSSAEPPARLRHAPAVALQAPQG